MPILPLWSTFTNAQQPCSSTVLLPFGAAKHVSAVRDAHNNVFVPCEARYGADASYVMVYRLKRAAAATCSYCGASNKQMTNDHVIPKAKLKARRGNTVPACMTCNAHKGCRGAGEWLLAQLRVAARTPHAFDSKTLLQKYERVDAWLVPGEFCKEVLQEWSTHKPTIQLLLHTLR